MPRRKKSTEYTQEEFIELGERREKEWDRPVRLGIETMVPEALLIINLATGSCQSYHVHETEGEEPIVHSHDEGHLAALGVKTLVGGEVTFEERGGSDLYERLMEKLKHFETLAAQKGEDEVLQ